MLVGIWEGRSSKSKSRAGNRGRQDTDDIWDELYDYEDAENDCIDDWRMEDDETEDVDEMISEAMQEDEDLDALEDEMVAQAIEQSILAQLIKKAEETEILYNSMTRVAGFGLVSFNEPIQYSARLETRPDSVSSSDDDMSLDASHSNSKNKKVFVENEEARNHTHTRPAQRHNNPQNNPLHPRWFMPEAKPVIVNMSCDEILPATLESQYGCHYMEANIIPRRFSLDMSDMLRDKLMTSKAIRKEVPQWDLEAYLVGEVVEDKADGLVVVRFVL